MWFTHRLDEDYIYSGSESFVQIHFLFSFFSFLRPCQPFHEPGFLFCFIFGVVLLWDFQIIQYDILSRYVLCLLSAIHMTIIHSVLCFPLVGSYKVIMLVNSTEEWQVLPLHWTRIFKVLLSSLQLVIPRLICR